MHVGCSGERPDTLEILIRKAENGFVVEAFYPDEMLPNAAAEMTEDLMASLRDFAAKREAGGEAGPADLFKLFGDAVSKVKKPAAVLRKAHEEYIFSNMETMLQFVKETFESAEKRE